MMLFSFKSFVFFVILLGFTLKVQAQTLSIRNYNLIDGLPESTIKSIFEDNYGYLWFATQGGVARFDGKKMETFTTEHGLLSNNIYAILQDSKRNIWVATRYGIGKFDGKIFKMYTKEDGLASNDITCILEDKESNLWFGTAEGVSKFDGEKFTNFGKQNGLIGRSTWCLMQDDKQNIWIGTQYGLSKYDGNSFTNYRQEDGLGDNLINHIMQDQQKNIWVGTAKGISKLQGKKFITYNKEEDDLPSNNIWYILEDSEKYLWLGTSSGAVKFDKNTGKMVQQVTTVNGLISNEVNYIIKDRNGDIWFGTDSGLSKLTSEIFKVYTSNSFQVKTSVWSVWADENNYLWFGTSGEGVIRFREEDNSVKFFTTEDGLPDNFIKSIMQDKAGNFWFGTFEGVSKYDGKTFKNFTKEDGLLDNTIYSITLDKDGKMWFGTDKGLSMYDGKKFETFTTKQGLADNYVRASTIDKEGNLWFGTYNGISKFDGKKFDNFSTKNGLANNLVLSVLQDSYGTIWFATENGLCKIKENAVPSDSACFTCYTKKDGLVSQNIWLLVEDKEKNIWVGHRTGVEKFNIKDEEFRHYGYLDGFKLIQTYPNSVFQDKKGNLWFGALNGVVKYNPKADNKNTNPPKVHITNVRLFNDQVDWSLYADTLDNYFYLPKFDERTKRNVSLPYNKNHITFEFVGIHFIVPEKVRYKYQLEGFEEEWSELTDQTNVTYTNLKPGRYRFLITAFNSDGIETPEPTSFDFVIETPYWERWWFYLIQLGLFISLIGLSIYFNARVKDSQITIALSFVTLLVLFEFINVYLESFLDDYIENVPLYKTLINVIVAIMFTPLEGIMKRIFSKTRPD